MSVNTEVSSSGIGFGGVVFIVFLTLKLLSVEPVASWSWWWVTCPLWIPYALIFGIIGIVLLFTAIVGAIAAIVGHFK